MVPEGLVLLTSVAFAAGALRLARRRVLVAGTGGHRGPGPGRRAVHRQDRHAHQAGNAAGRDRGTGRPACRACQARSRSLAVLAAGTGLGAAVAMLTRDVIIGVAAGAGFSAAAARLVKAWPGHHIRR